MVGAAVTGLGIVTTALPAAAAAVSPWGDTPSGTPSEGGTPVSMGFNSAGPNYLFDITWRTTDLQDVTYTYSWYYNDTTPRTLGGTGTATGRVEIDPVDSRWLSSAGGSSSTISCYIMDSAGVKYKWENKYRNSALTFVAG